MMCTEAGLGVQSAVMYLQYHVYLSQLSPLIWVPVTHSF